MGMISNWVGRKLAPVNVEKTKARVREAAGPQADAESVAERLTEQHARRSALRGFLTGVPGGLWTMPLMLVDVRGVWSERASLAAGLRYHRDPAFFDDPGWWKQVWRDTSGVPVENGVRAGVKGLARFAVQEAVLRRVGKSVVRRTGARFVPVLGGVVGAAYNYAWVKREGSRMRVDILGDLPDEKA